MELFVIALLAVAIAVLLVLWVRNRQKAAASELSVIAAETARAELAQRLLAAEAAAQTALKDLERFQGIADIEAHAASLTTDAHELLQSARTKAEQIRLATRQQALKVLQEAKKAANEQLHQAQQQAATLREEASKVGATARQQALNILQRAKATAQQHSDASKLEHDRLIAEAVQNAEKIHREAKESTAIARKTIDDARNDAAVTRQQAQHLAISLREEATRAGENIIAEAKATAQQHSDASKLERDRLIAEAVQNAEKIHREAKESTAIARKTIDDARNDAAVTRQQAQHLATSLREEATKASENIIAEAKATAQQHSDASKLEHDRLIAEAVQNAEKIHREAKESTAIARKTIDDARNDAAVTRQQAQHLATSLREEATRASENIIAEAKATAQQHSDASKLERDRLIAEAVQAVAKIHREAKESAATARETIDNAHRQAVEIRGNASATLQQAHQAAAEIRRTAKEQALTQTSQAESRIVAAGEEAARIIENAKKRAEDIAGDAYMVMGRANEFADAAHAMERVINGYGNEFIIPTFSLLDELADEFGHTEPGAALKKARESTRALIRAGQAATCLYVEDVRRKTAINFVVDAFNGKVDSILARGKSDNYGKLEQEIRDAFALVNHNGRAFREAKITPEYLDARLAELKWGAVARALKEQEREEQRQLREQIREEERARREYERAMKDAAKEEEMLRKAMEKVQKQVASANAAQREEFEAKLAELQERLTDAEAKNQRALSMAQQTRAGHVYVISNVGSFGEDVFKIGMTRRLEPRDRVRELGDASVPFEFDIHAMLYSDDAPTLERDLHRHFLRHQMNKVNPRKEFFRVTLADIRREVEARNVIAHWTMMAEARSYRESLRIEQQIRESPEVEREWTVHQMEYEPEMEEEALEAIA